MSKLLPFDDAFRVATSMRNKKEAKKFMTTQEKEKEDRIYRKALRQRQELEAAKREGKNV